MDEDNTHLLLATNWDVQGGAGGAPGRHGKPGQGGKGGKGGAGHKWQVSSNIYCQRWLLIVALGVGQNWLATDMTAHRGA